MLLHLLTLSPRSKVSNFKTLALDMYTNICIEDPTWLFLCRFEP